MDTLSNVLNINIQNINWPYINQNPYFNDNVTIYKSLLENKKSKIINNKLSTINSKNIKIKTKTNTTTQVLSKDDKKFFFTLRTPLFNNLSFYKTDPHNSFYHSIWVCLSPNFNYFVNSAEHYHFKDYIYLYFSEKNIFNSSIKGKYKVTKKNILNKLKEVEYCVYKLLILSKIFKINIIIYKDNELSCHDFNSDLPSIIIYINNDKHCFPLINPKNYNTWAWDSSFILKLKYDLKSIEFEKTSSSISLKCSLKELQELATKHDISIKYQSPKTSKLILKTKQMLVDELSNF